MKKFTHIIFCISIFALQFFAQQPTQEWVRRYSPGANLSASGLSVKQDSSGNVYVLVRQGSDTSYGDYGLLKYSPGGNLLWSVKYNSPGNLDETPKAFDVSKAGDIYITGSSGLNFDYNSLTVKYNSNGVLQWDKIFTGIIEGNDIAIDREGNILIVGNSRKILKYNPNGDTLWTRDIIISNYSNILTKLIVDDSSNVYAAGYSSFNTQTTNYLTVKYNSSGSLIWYSLYGVTGYAASANSIAIDSSKNVYVVGVLNVPQPGFWDNVLIKISKNGILQWAKNYTGINNNHSCSVTPVGLSVTSNGNNIFYTTSCYASVSSQFVTISYNSNGDTNWVRLYSMNVTGIPNNNPVNLKMDSYSNIYITGSLYNNQTGDDYIAIKYLPSGIQQWVITYNGFNDFGDYANDILIDSSLIYITGLSKNSSNSIYESSTIKYNQIIGIISNTSELPTRFKLYQNYPNPFNPFTIIDYEIPVKGFVQLKLYNLLGQKIKTLVEKEHNPSYYTLMFNAEGISSGIYFYTLIVNNQLIDSKKLIVVK